MGTVDEPGRVPAAPERGEAPDSRGEDIRVTHDWARHRWEAWAGDALAGFMSYRRSEGTIDFRHTEVDPAFEGRGVGSALVRVAIAEVESGSEAVLASCPFVAAWLERHPQHQHLLGPHPT